jgi:lysophospholipase L1-like esterase
MKKNRRFLIIALILSLFLNLIIGFKYFKKFYWEYFERKPFITYKYERDKLFEALKTESTDIVFLGNSITQHFEVFELLKNTRVRNRGIGGETTLGALERLKTITDGKPSKIFLMLGINDLSNGKNVPEILSNYEKIIKKIIYESPETEIIIESVLPISKFKEKIICCENANEKIGTLNKGLKNLASINSIKYLDLHSSFVEKGGLKINLTVDGIHLNGAGYLVLSNLIKDYLK